MTPTWHCQTEQIPSYGIILSMVRIVGPLIGNHLHHHHSHHHQIHQIHPASRSWVSALLSCLSLDCLVGSFLGATLFWTLKGVLLVHHDPAILTVEIAAVPQRSEDPEEQRIKLMMMKQNKSDPRYPVTIGYAVSVTGCGSDPITEGAAVLKHSIHRNHHDRQRYDYEMICIYHPQAETCTMPLRDLGYTLLRRDTPVPVDQIQGQYLRTKISTNGCCGEKELIKLEAYTLTDYPIVVHLDLDTLVLKPLDTIFDLMLGQPVDDTKSLPMFPNQDIPSIVNAAFTYDYNMVRPSVKYKPVQGGFLVIKPDRNVYEEYRSIIRKGDFQPNGGWGGQVGPFYGSMTFQGIIPYYYNVLHPGQSLELNRCRYNQMCDNPRTEKTVNDQVHGDCRTGENDCQDCRAVPLESVVTTHFTLCQKPWSCLSHSQDEIQHRLCRKLTHEWYKVRSEMEQSWGRSGRGTGSYEPDMFFGYCTKSGGAGYIRIEAPYGKPTPENR